MNYPAAATFLLGRLTPFGVSEHIAHAGLLASANASAVVTHQCSSMPDLLWQCMPQHLTYAE